MKSSWVGSLAPNLSPRRVESSGEGSTSNSDTEDTANSERGSTGWRTLRKDAGVDGGAGGQDGAHKNDHHYHRHWSLHWSESIYDETFIVLLRHGHVRDGKWKYPRGALTHAMTLLLLNLFLQGVVLWKVHSLSEAEKAKLHTELAEICETVPESSLNFSRNLKEQPAPGSSFIDCQPLSLTLMREVEELDRNGDGLWSKDEARQTMEDMERRSSREADLPLVFHRFLRLARDGGLVMHDVGRNRSYFMQATQNWTVIPMDMLRKEQPAIELCSLNDPYMCANIEARGILHRKVPSALDGSMDIVDNRIEWCEKLQSTFCHGLFGERYKLYGDRTLSLCGSRHVLWDKGKRIRRVLYDQSYKYVSSSDGVVHVPYISFLLVILLIWFAAILREGRDVCLWWLVLLQLPVCETSLRVEHPEEDFRIESVPSVHKWVMIVLNLFPRTIICLALLVVGAQFLIRADDYTNLILNSVALGFLVEVDNMIFAAVASDTSKSHVRHCQPCKVRGLPYHSNTQTMLFTVGLVIFAVLIECWSYLHPYGKLALGESLICLCQVSGIRCVSAQVLGGLPHLEGLDSMTWIF